MRNIKYILFGNKDNNLEDLKSDFPASIVVFLVALPLCLGIALASGAPLFSGIIAGISGGIIAGLFSGSALSVSGPAAGLTIIVFRGIENLGFETFLLAVFIGGFIQLLMGLLRAGIISHFFPSSVIKGMLAGIGLILIIKQFPVALGYEDGGFLAENISAAINGNGNFAVIWKAIHFIQPGALIITLISLAILILWERPFFKNKKSFKLLPGALVVVILGTMLNLLFKNVAPAIYLDTSHLVNLPVPSSLTEFAGQFTLPDFNGFYNPQVWVVGLTLAIVASLETLLCVEAADKMDPYKRRTPTSRELKAQGAGNMVSGILGGIPITAVIVRTTANTTAGAKTKKSAIMHGFLLLFSVILIPAILNAIPLASLAAILLVVGYKLARVSVFKQMYQLGWSHFLPFTVTVVGILYTDLLQGIALGMVVAIFYILRNNYRVPYFFQEEKDPNGDKIRIRLSEDVSFLNKASMQLTLDRIPENSQVVIDGTHSRNIDYDVKEILENFKATAATRNINLELKGIEDSKIHSHH